MKYTKFLLFLLIALLSTGVYGCMGINNYTPNRTETDYEYSELMLDYVKNKYGKDFTIIESDFPKEGFNTDMQVSTLAVQETETGMIVNVHALLGSPYKFSDDYIEALAGYMIKDKIDTSAIDAYAKSKLYAYPDNSDSVEDLSVEALYKITLVVNVTKEPDEEVLKSLYSVYGQLSEMNAEYICMIVGFTEEREIFTKYVDNYRLYGDKSWIDYPGFTYATMRVFDKGLSLEEFTALCADCR